MALIGIDKIDSFVLNSCGFKLVCKKVAKLQSPDGASDFNYCIFFNMIEIGKPPGELNGQHTLFPAHNFGSYLGFLAPHPKPCNGK